MALRVMTIVLRTASAVTAAEALAINREHRGALQSAMDAVAHAAEVSAYS